MTEVPGKPIATLTAVFLLLGTPVTTIADPQTGLTLRTGAYIDEGDPLLGIDYQIPMSTRLSLVPNAEYVFVDRGDLFTFNVDSRYDLNPSAPNPMWVGAGVGAIHRDVGPVDDTDPALNLLWGMDFTSDKNWTPFVSSKAILSDDSELSINFGIRFGHIGGASTAQQSDVDNGNVASNPR